ncbi:hypothetical protein JUJ52_08770 [Virgibacillus sp. AGTR]|uniref:hypothetical protein n=1 Tax=Virgibacillus sp. AGTR TaxID=2812055 RepID=UPI001962D6CD|nr:hypothetical protein [Virgibacillus sp. AGTR]MCC2250058.1 hypothetical protein [Virgibacillus sp. AGTR]QRZ17781.1 hypothetical protein JUJ52_18885 [Virgibacillus sp. AGTR]
MKAWHTQDINGEMQEIVFAETRAKAIYQSEAYGWTDYINVRIKRARYADGLEGNPKQLKQSMLENGWWFECDSCLTHVDIENLINQPIVTNNGKVMCDTCFNKKFNRRSNNELK